MHIMIIGASGMIGSKLTARVLEKGVNGEIPDQLTLIDLTACPVPKGMTATIKSLALDLTKDGSCRKLAEFRPDIVFFLAAVVSSAAEENFEKAFQRVCGRSVTASAHDSRSA